MRVKKKLFWVLLLLFIGLSVWWIFYFPYNPERLYRAIPANAIFISEHEKLAERWQTFASNPLTVSLLSYLGIEPDELDEIADDPGITALVKMAGARDTVLAYMPSLAGPGGSAWVLSSWVGSYGQLMKWGLFRGVLSDFERIKLDGGRRGWLLVTEKTNGKSRLSLAVIEGVLVCCLSPDPRGVRHIVNRIESGASLFPELEKRLTSKSDHDCLDRGWISYQPRMNSPEPLKLSYVLTSYGTNSVEGRVRGEWGTGIEHRTSNIEHRTSKWGRNGRGEKSLPADDPSTSLRAGADGRGGGRDLEGLKDILGDAPCAFAVAPYAYVEPVLCGNDLPDGLRIAGDILKAAKTDEGLVFACLFGGDYSGRILGMAVPTVVMGVEARENNKALDAVIKELDKFNARYGWALIPRRIETGGHVFVVLDRARRSIYDSLGSTGKPVFVEKHGWLIFASNMQALKKIIIRPAGNKANGAWVTGMEAGDASAYAWLDLESTGRTLKNAIAVYSLILMVQNTRDSSEQRENLAQMGAWIDSLRPLKTCFLRLNSDGSKFELHFKLGPEVK